MTGTELAPDAPNRLRRLRARAVVLMVYVIVVVAVLTRLAGCHTYGSGV